MRLDGPFAPALALDLPYGRLAGVRLPAAWDSRCEDALALLDLEVSQLAQTMSALRRVSFVGGRLAAKLAGEALGVPCDRVLPGDGGAPAFPAGVAGSISHKPGLAVALVARADGSCVGVDLEELEADRSAIARRVLSPAELASCQRLPAYERWEAVACRFSLKEAIYKAIYPFVRRLVGFHEVAVEPLPDGAVSVDLALRPPSGPQSLAVEARWMRLDRDLLLTIARARIGAEER